MMTYRVKSGCVIFHDDKEYKSGESVELTEVQALVHATNIEVATNEHPNAEPTEEKQPETIKEVLESQEGSGSEINLLPTDAGTHQPIAETPSEVTETTQPVEPTPDPNEIGKPKSVSK
ncbi:MAG: hypothetical protein ACRC11_11020 [Xenococcaceae cyanobacterium]